MATVFRPGAVLCSVLKARMKLLERQGLLKKVEVLDGFTALQAKAPKAR